MPHLADLDVQSAVGLFGLGAVFLGLLPGGVVGQAGRLGAAVRQRLAEVYRDARRRPEPPPALVPSDFAERILAERDA